MLEISGRIPHVISWAISELMLIVVSSVWRNKVLFRHCKFRSHPECNRLSSSQGKCLPEILWQLKAKFYYASWFGAGSRLVRSWFEPDSVIEFGFNPQLS